MRRGLDALSVGIVHVVWDTTRSASLKFYFLPCPHFMTSVTSTVWLPLPPLSSSPTTRFGYSLSGPESEPPDPPVQKRNSLQIVIRNASLTHPVSLRPLLLELCGALVLLSLTRFWPSQSPVPE